MKLDTQTVHAGNLSDPEGGGINSPLITSSAFRYLETPEVRYPRYFNTPNQNAVGHKLAVLEGGQAGKVFSSGMAAISTSFLSFLQAGDHVVLQRNLYGGTTYLANSLFNRLGISFDYAEPTPQGIAAVCKPETRIVYIETPSNPHLRLIDIAGVVAVAKERGLITIIDNTFASPVNQRPLALGIDISIHSGTKYLGGHSDLCCGAVVTSIELMQAIQSTSIVLGGSLDARVCHLLERSLKTLALRVRRQTEVATAIAQFLEKHPSIEAVYYPGLPSNPQFQLAKAQMSGFGAMLSFDLKKGTVDGVEFQKRLKLIAPAVSLGGVETTICSPALTSHAKLTEEERISQNITSRLLRLSCGIEAVEDLIADFQNALA